MLAQYVRNYLIHGLRASPELIERLLGEATQEDFDRRPDPERFTIREVVAHLADWDPIWRMRLERIVKEDEPLLESIDEGELAVKNKYDQLDVHEQLARFQRER